MKTTHLFLVGLASSALLAATALAGCGNSATGSGGAGGSGVSSSATTMQSSGTQSSSSGSMYPAAPTLGAQIDRFGRPAVNTALNATFETDPVKKGTAKDAYNADKDPSKWGGTYGPEFAKNLALFDGLDTMCGNQINAGPNPVAGRYNQLAGALADDRLWIKTDAATCTTYLSVEVAAIKSMPPMDCGGRKLDYDPIDASYTALSGAAMPIGDGVTADADTKGTAFPYLAAPH